MPTPQPPTSKIDLTGLRLETMRYGLHWSGLLMTIRCPYVRGWEMAEHELDKLGQHS